MLFYILALGAGAANPFQAGANAQLNKGLASPIWSAVWVYISGLIGVFFIQILVREAWPGARFGSNELPWWAWMGGLLSIGSTVAGLTMAQKMGSGTFTGITLTASLITSVLLDQFGLVGFKQHTASPMRLTGAGLLIAGIWMIVKS